MYKRHRSGFTLLEVLVALAVLAIGLGAVIKVASQGSANMIELRERTLAGWVARNKVNEWLLAASSPAPGSSRGITEMAGQQWRWQVRISETPDRVMRRLDIVVSSERAPAVALVELAAFRARDSGR